MTACAPALNSLFSNSTTKRYRLYSLRDRGVVELVSRGVYRLVELPPIANLDLVTVNLRIPTQIPHVVSVAMPRGSRIPSLDHPPVRVHNFSRAAFTSDGEEHLLDGVTVKICGPEKTLADCFKFRNKIGMDVALESLS